jgi:TetR/AcrR family transcriptional regulator, cholesterol catabolism regulator
MSADREAGGHALREPMGYAAEPADTPRRQQRKTETRERVLNAASELFVRKGLEETTFDDIAHHAGVARQTVFNHFPRKEDFVVAWGTRRRDDIAQLLSSNAFSNEQTAARIILIMRVLADFYERTPIEGRVFTLAWVKWGGPVIEDPTLATQIATVIADGQNAGDIRDDISAHTAGRLIRAAYFDALWRWASPNRPPDAPSLFSDILAHLELLLTGLCVVPDREGLKKSMRLARAIEVTRNSG